MGWVLMGESEERRPPTADLFLGTREIDLSFKMIEQVIT
jgi:hypothetical protein